MTISTLTQKRDVVLAYLNEHGPSTVDEFLGDERYVNSWAPTFTHLYQDGFIRPTGEMRPTRWGAPANVWEVVS